MTLALAMVEAAQKAGDSLRWSKNLGMQFGEVTITETSLLHLVRESNNLRVSMKADGEPESKTGVDYEIWIEGGPDYWFHFLVQAKKLKIGDTLRATGVYDVGYLSGNKPKKQTLKSGVYAKSQRPQIDLILEKSGGKTPAIYALYNEAGRTLRGRDLPKTTKYVGQLCHSSLVDGMDGISVLPALQMKKWLEWTRIKSGNPDLVNAVAAGVASQAFPWSCLVACPKESMCLKFREKEEVHAYNRGIYPKWEQKRYYWNDPAHRVASNLWWMYIRAIQSLTPPDKVGKGSPVHEDALETMNLFERDENHFEWWARNENLVNTVNDIIEGGFTDSTPDYLPPRPSAEGPVIRKLKPNDNKIDSAFREEKVQPLYVVAYYRRFNENSNISRSQ